LAVQRQTGAFPAELSGKGGFEDAAEKAQFR
jgi:hypothetical protein